jgi:hypothetical protein
VGAIESGRLRAVGQPNEWNRSGSNHVDRGLEALGIRAHGADSNPLQNRHDERYEEDRRRLNWPRSVIAISSGPDSQNAPRTCRSRTGVERSATDRYAL